MPNRVRKHPYKGEFSAANSPGTEDATNHFKPPVLFLQLLELPDLVGFQTLVLLLPAIEVLLGGFPTWRISSATGIPTFRLLQHGHDLLHRTPLPLHGKPPFSSSRFCRKLTIVSQKTGSRSLRPDREFLVISQNVSCELSR